MNILSLPNLISILTGFRYRFPYEVGNNITLRPGAPYDNKTIEGWTSQVFRPFTLSCVLSVALHPPAAALGMPECVILKLLDRRFGYEVRDDETER